MSPRSIRARKVEVHADSITGKTVNRQTGNHEGQSRTASKHVTVEVVESSSKNGSNDDHPPSGTILRTDKASINAKTVIGPLDSSKYRKGQKRIVAKRDVTVILKDTASARGRGRA